ncbi:tRNA adenosine(34) deaminase TadA [Pseudomonas sp. gcc21]|uniref:tRNA adenosine(34) deaminase TadA n=1 Tax=Pseudomonas sp. gcc21 TaxID=2726989 RepID=UPI0014517F69|nr:tRNA adenosine(34) deaminase TadA [Pseudomonas sp. gcc21]QJD60477.1 tRNA adenosine(34) deaminase TadA [Pseudomonas sp. gcc21]
MKPADIDFMRLALAEAEQAAACGEVPVGAVLVQDGRVIGRGFNQPIVSHDPSAHAEMVALRQAATKQQNYRLPDSTLYVTLEPCTMCAGLLIHSRVKRLVFGATEPRAGAVVSRSQILAQPWMNHRIEVEGGVLEEECAAVLTAFFKARRGR